MKLEVGDYVRTKTKGIRKIDRIDENKTVNKYLYYIGTDDDNDQCFGIIKTTDIVKHSKNIIDLLEVGDYVNKRLVLQVDYKNKNVCLLIPFSDTKANTNIMWYGYEDIKSIVTHEQFSSMEYKVEER